MHKVSRAALVVACGLTVTICGHEGSDSASVTDRSRPASTKDLAPRELPAAVAATYRLAPDRRFINAAGDVTELLGGKRREIVIDFVQNAWVVTLGSQPAGRLPQLPTFDEGLRFVEGVARAARPKPDNRPAARDVLARVDTLVRAFDVQSLLQALKTLDDAAGEKSGGAEIWRRRATIAALLNVQTIDRFGLADPVRSRGLAVLAIARSLDPSCCAEEAALLANAFAYDVEAAALARQLPADSRARAYVLQSPVSAPSDPFGRYVDARHRLRTASTEERFEIGKDLDRGAAPLLLDHTTMRDVEGVSRYVAAVLIQNLGSKEADPEAPSIAQAKVFEKQAEDRSAALASRTFPAETIQALFRSTFYSAVFEEFDYYYERLASRGAVEDFVAAAPTMAPDATDRIVRWMKDLVTIKYASVSNVAIHDELQKLEGIGGERACSLLMTYADAVGIGDPRVLDALAAVFARADTRSVDLFAVGSLADRVLHDAFRRDQYMETAISRSPERLESGTLGWYAAIVHDLPRVRSIAESKDADDADRANALLELGKQSEEYDGFIRSSFEAMLGQDTSTYSKYAQFLNLRRDWKTKERIARDVLDRNRERPDHTIESAYYASSLADALEHQKRYDEAMAVVSNYLDVGSFSIVEAAISIQQGLGKNDKAHELADALLDRYPGAAALAIQAAVLWRERRFDDAAAMFDPSKHSYAVEDLRDEVPWLFADVFASSPIDQIRAAIAPLVSILPADVLNDVVGEFEKVKDHERAFAVAEFVSAQPKRSDRADPDVALMTAWKILAEWKGAHEANEWMHAHLPGSRLISILLAAHRDGHHELVLEFAAPQQSGAKNREAELLEAASLLALHVPKDDPRFQALVNVVSSQRPQPETFQPVTRYLLGLDEESRFWSWGKSRDQMLTMLYFYGLRKAAEGHYDEAEPWILAAATQPDVAWAKYFAQGLLQRWSRQSWARTKQQQIM